MDSTEIRRPANFDAPLLIDCDPAYDVTKEMAIFGAQLIYLIPALVLHARRTTIDVISDRWPNPKKCCKNLLLDVDRGSPCHVALLRVLLFTHRKELLDNSYYVIFSMDCVVNTLLIASTLLFDRPIIYLTFLCPSLVSFFSVPSVILQFVFVQPYYLRVAKLSIQILSTLNRMTCVVMPLGYSRMWKRRTKLALAVVVVSPFTVIWNILVSRPFPIPIYGGFSFGYLRRFEWASLSLLMLIFQLLALLITSVSTVITLFYLFHLPERLKSAERSLCSASICISVCFILNSFFQIYFAFVRGQNFKTLYALQYLAFDLLIIGTPVVLIFYSQPLKSKLGIRNNNSVTVVVSTSSNNNSKY